MVDVEVVGLDPAKRLFQVHGVDAEGGLVIRRQLRRSQVLNFFRALRPCLVGMEACASAHHWGRELAAMGHEVRLMPPAYVKAYVKRGKTDAADAEAIAEAVTRPTMRFVAVKSQEQQAALMLHKTRDLLIRQRTMLINALRGHLYEFGMVVAKGAAGAKKAVAVISDDTEELPALARASLRALADQLATLEAEIAGLERRILAWHRANEASRRLATIPGVGPITATAIAASVPDPSLFRSGRQFAAWLGLTPHECSSGGKERQAGISKMGDGYIRRLLVIGATAMLRIFRQRGGGAWITALMTRKKPKAAAADRRGAQTVSRRWRAPGPGHHGARPKPSRGPKGWSGVAGDRDVLASSSRAARGPHRDARRLKRRPGSAEQDRDGVGPARRARRGWSTYAFAQALTTEQKGPVYWGRPTNSAKLASQKACGPRSRACTARAFRRLDAAMDVHTLFVLRYLAAKPSSRADPCWTRRDISPG